MYARLIGTGSCLPGKPVTNDDLAARGIDTNDEWIVTRTGIRSRHLAEPGTTSSELGLLAAQRALEMAGNVREWCHSLLIKYPYDSKDGRENSDGDGGRAVKGGLWHSGRHSAYCAYRRHHPPDDHYDGTGFRVVIGPKLD